MNAHFVAMRNEWGKGKVGFCPLSLSQYWLSGAILKSRYNWIMRGDLRKFTPNTVTVLLTKKKHFLSVKQCFKSTINKDSTSSDSNSYIQKSLTGLRQSRQSHFSSLTHEVFVLLKVISVVFCFNWLSPSDFYKNSMNEMFF